MTHRNPVVSFVAVFMLALVWGTGAFGACFPLGGAAHAALAGHVMSGHAHQERAYDAVAPAFHGHEAANAQEDGHELVKCCNSTELRASALTAARAFSPFEMSPSLAARAVPVAWPSPLLWQHMPAMVQTGPPLVGATPVGLHNLLLI
ncbi:predicted protein [Tepidicaulis marinus]|uniref:Uncharacterized protein n=1 Tax=Tepidicaulis marinus TaxID=1333998 RepID=A0A081B640_9HYPH|nr:hypothetical protein [Tepidicaulis marinus]GAK43508.1 predicted protein [Tepidicaulis marinus]